VVHGAALDRPDEADTVIAAEAVWRSLNGLGFQSAIVDVGCDLAALGALRGARPYAVFNLIEALGGVAERAIAAVRRLDELDLAYTGAGARAYAVTNSKTRTKAILREAGIATPRHWLGGGAVPADTIVIVKAIDEHGSLGMDQGSVVAGREAAAEITAREARFGGRFFAEAFVYGREFNVSLLEIDGTPQVLPIAEIDFAGLPAGHVPIVDFAAKWDADAPAFHATPRRFGLEAREPSLAAEITRLALASYGVLGLSGYARVDFRVGANGPPLVLEANANPCLAPDAGFAAAAAEAGLGYEDAISAIVATAVRRRGPSGA
jgi:D-alanine-D-alanine ligase